MRQVSVLTIDEYEFLQQAVDYLERPSFLIKAANLIGRPAEVILEALPARAQKIIGEATAGALRSALETAVRSLPRSTALTVAAQDGGPVRSSASRHLHTAMTATTGALGGMFGLAGIAIEVPATTTLMLRSIAAIAAENGADLADPEVRLQCLSVFSFGSPSLEKMESAYFSGRVGLALAVRDAAAFLAAHTGRELTEAISKGTAPVLVRLLNQIASRFQLVVSQKFALQAVPIAGAATGALINAAFTDHFNNVARFHFGIVRLERIYGKKTVEAAYDEARRVRFERAGASTQDKTE